MTIGRSLRSLGMTIGRSLRSLGMTIGRSLRSLGMTIGRSLTGDDIDCLLHRLLIFCRTAPGQKRLTNETLVKTEEVPQG